MRGWHGLLILLVGACCSFAFAQRTQSTKTPKTPSPSPQANPVDEKLFSRMRWRQVGPFRGGRVLAVTGVPGEPSVFYFGGASGAGLKTSDTRVTWHPLFEQHPISSLGAIAVASSCHNLIYAGSGEACIRGNITYGNGVYKS